MRRVRREPLAIDLGAYVEVKDPCPVLIGDTWHLYATGVTAPFRFEVVHATAPTTAGPWHLHRPARVDGVRGSCVAAPGLVVEDGVAHLFVQTDFDRFGGTLEHCTSRDGESFRRRDTALRSDADRGEAGVYDPHPALVAGERLLVYAAFAVVGQPDVHLARSTGDSWDGPWERLGPVLRHDEVALHNQRDDADYEWGLEGAQLVELPDGRVLLAVVCFLAGEVAGRRQRVVLAVADGPLGPYSVIGPVLDTPGGENGHATALVSGDRLELFVQERSGGPWRVARASLPLEELTPLEAAR